MSPKSNVRRSETVLWPFYRYKVLLPKEVKGDIFQWLYISLVTYFNENEGRPINSYSEFVEIEARRVIEQKFGSIISKNILDRVIENSKSECIVGEKIDSKIIEKLDVYQNLFSDKLEMRYIFQDAVTGSVLPFFYDPVDLDSRLDGKLEDQTKGKRIRFSKNVDRPSVRNIQLAYSKFIHVSRFNPSEDYDDSLESEYDDFINISAEVEDPDAQVYLPDDSELIPEEHEKIEKTELKTLRDCNVIFVDGRELYHYKVQIKIQDDRIIATTPFDRQTSNWMSGCFNKGCSVNSELKDIRESFNEIIEIEEKKIFEELSDGSISSRFKFCPDIYRIVDGLGDNSIRRLVVKMERDFNFKDEEFYLHAGNLLESIVRKIINPNMTLAKDRVISFNEYCGKLSKKLDKKILYSQWINPDVYRSWKSAFNDRGLKHSLKTDLVDLFITTDVVDDG